MKYVGKVGVRVVPDTKRFEAVMKKLEGEKRETFIDAALRAKEAEAKKKELGSDVRFRVIADASRTNLDRVRQQIADMRKDAEKVKLDLVDPAELERMSKNAKNIMQKAARLELKIDAGDLDGSALDAARRKYADLVEAAQQIRDERKRLMGLNRQTLNTYDEIMGRVQAETEAMRELETHVERIAALEKQRDAAAKAHDPRARARAEAAVTEEVQRYFQMLIQRSKELAAARQESLAAATKSGLSRVDADLDPAQDKLKQIKADLQEITGNKRKLKLEADISKTEKRIEALNKKLREVAKPKAPVRLQADFKQAEKRLAALRKQLKDTTSNRARLELTLGDSIREAEVKLEGLRRKLAQASNETTKVNLEVQIDNTDARLSTLRRQLADLGKDQQLEIKADISEAEKEVKRLGDQLKTALKPGDTTALQKELKDAVHVLDGLNAELAKVSDPKRAEELEKQAREVGKVVEALKERRAEILRIAEAEKNAEDARLKRELKNIENERKTTLNVDVDDAAAKAQLAWAARTRVVTLLVRVSGIQQARAALATLTGVKFIERIRDQLYSFAKNLDTTALKLTALAPVVASAASAFVSLVPGVVNVLHGFVQLAPASLVLASGLGAAAISAGSLYAIFGNLSESSSAAAQAFNSEWSRVKDTFGEIRTEMQEAFFSQGATRALRDLADNLLPEVRRGLIGISNAMGFGFASLLDQFNQDFSGGRAATFFDNMRIGIERSIPGLRLLLSGVHDLAMIGSEYFPSWGDWLTEIGTRFKNWASDTEHINKLIANAVFQFGELKRAGGAFIDVLSGIMRAANTNGESGFTGMANGLERLAAWLNSPMIQRGMAMLFHGAQEGAGAFLAAIGRMPAEVERVLTLIGGSLMVLGDAFANLTEGLLTAFSQPEVFEGVTRLTSAIRDGIANIDWEGVGRAIGAIATTIANMIPIVVQLINAFLPYIPPITSAMNLILGATERILAVIGPLVPAALAAVAAFSGFQQVSSAVGGLDGALGLLRGSLSFVTSGFGLFSIAATAAVGALVYLYVTNEDFRNSVNGTVQRIWEAANAIYTALKPALDVLAPVLKVVVDLLLQFAGNQFLMALQAVAVAFETLATTIQWVADGIKSILEFLRLDTINWGELFKGDFTGIFNSMTSESQGTFDRFTRSIGGLFGGLVADGTSKSTTLSDTVRNRFGSMRDNSTSAFNTLANQGSSLFERLRSSATNSSSTMGNQVSSAARLMQSNFLAAIGNLVNTTVSQLSSLGGRISGIVSGWGGYLWSAGVNMMNGLYGGIAAAANRVLAYIQSIANRIAAAARNALRIHSPSRVFFEIGDYTMQGWALGMEQPQAVARVLHAVSDVAGQLRGSATIDLRDTVVGVPKFDVGALTPDAYKAQFEYFHDSGDGNGMPDHLTGADAALIARALVAYLAPAMDEELTDLGYREEAYI